MAQNLNKTKRRISSIKSTKKITKAMELVSTVKLRRYKNVMLENNLYTDEIISLMNLLLSFPTSKDDEGESLYLKENIEANDTLYLVITSNLGLCASFNNDVFHFVKENISKDNTLIVPIGLKGDEYFQKEGYKIDERFVKANERINYSDIKHISDFLLKSFLDKKYKSIKLVYTHYINSIRFKPTLVNIFPLEGVKKVDLLAYPPIFDSDVSSLIDEFIPLYTTSLLYQRIVEAQVSEQANRRMAMENANDNADELINKLTLEYNKARQAQITQEISEVISGAIE